MVVGCNLIRGEVCITIPVWITTLHKRANQTISLKFLLKYHHRVQFPPSFPPLIIKFLNLAHISRGGNKFAHNCLLMFDGRLFFFLKKEKKNIKYQNCLAKNAGPIKYMAIKPSTCQTTNAKKDYIFSIC